MDNGSYEAFFPFTVLGSHFCERSSGDPFLVG